MLEESQEAKKVALLDMQRALETLREEMGEAQASGSIQRVLTERVREEDAIRATVRTSRAALRYKLAELTVRYSYSNTLANAGCREEARV